MAQDFWTVILKDRPGMPGDVADIVALLGLAGLTERLLPA